LRKIVEVTNLLGTAKRNLLIFKNRNFTGYLTPVLHGEAIMLG